MDDLKTTQEDLARLLRLYGAQHPGIETWTAEDWDNDALVGDETPEDSDVASDEAEDTETLTEEQDGEAIELAFGIGGLIRGAFGGRAGRPGSGGMGGEIGNSGRHALFGRGHRFNGSERGQPKGKKGLAGREGVKGKTHTVGRKRATGGAEKETTPNGAAKRRTAKPKTVQAGYKAKPKAIGAKAKAAGVKVGAARQELARKYEGINEARANRPKITNDDQAALARVEAAQKALIKAKTAMTKAEKAREAIRTKTMIAGSKEETEIHKLEGAARRADNAEVSARMNVGHLVLRERAVKAGEAAKAKDPQSPKALRYQKMLDNERLMLDARKEFDRLEKVHNASREAYDRPFYKALSAAQKSGAYSGKWGGTWITNWAKFHRDNPDLKPLEAQKKLDERAYLKAASLKYKYEQLFYAARDSLAQRYVKSQQKAIDQAEQNHPSYAGKLQARKDAYAALEKANGDAAVRVALDARSKAESELSQAMMARNLGTAKYGYHDEPIQSALYKDLNSWSHDQLGELNTLIGSVKHVKNQTGDIVLAKVQGMQGFDHPPDLLSAREIEAHIRAGEVELWRGDTKQDYTDMMLKGEYHPGLGYRANGTYAQEGKNGWQTAKSYASMSRHGVQNARITRMTLKSNARIIGYGQLKSEQARDVRHFEDEGKAAAKRGDLTEAARLQDLSAIIAGETGRYAAMRGYDAVHFRDAPNQQAAGQWVILNRSALRISNQVFPGDYNGDAHVTV